MCDNHADKCFMFKCEEELKVGMETENGNFIWSCEPHENIFHDEYIGQPLCKHDDLPHNCAKCEYEAESYFEMQQEKKWDATAKKK